MLIDLEKYLVNNRKKLDVESPDDQRIWEGIRNKQIKKEEETGKPGKTRMLVRIRNIAAIIILILSIGYITIDILGKKISDRQVTLSDISEILGRREIEYKSLVNLKTNEARSSGNIDNLIIRELFKEIENLDAFYDQAMDDLKVMGYNEKIINTIFDIYEKKIYLLELIILESNKSGSYENNGNIKL